MRRCPSCSTQNRENARVCIQCGTSLPAVMEGSSALRPPTHMLDPAMEPMSIRPELETLLKKMAPESGDAVITLHLFGKNYPISRVEHLKILLDKNLIREDAPILHRDRGRWMEARHVANTLQHFDPEKTPRPEEQVSPTGNPEKRPSHADLILAARLGREAEQAASRGEVERAIEIYQQVLQLNERYPLVQKRLRELGRLLEEQGGAPPEQDRPSPGTLPLPKPPPSSQGNFAPSSRNEPSSGSLQIQSANPYPPLPSTAGPRREAPRSSFPSGEQPRVGGGNSGERPRVGGGISSERPRVGGDISGERPRVGGGISSERPRVGFASGEQPRVGGGISGERPRVGMPEAGGRSGGGRSSSEQPRVSLGGGFASQGGGASLESRRSPVPPSNERTHSPFPPSREPRRFEQGPSPSNASSGQMNVLPLPRSGPDAGGGSPYPVSVDPRDAHPPSQGGASPFIPQGRTGTFTPAPHHPSHPFSTPAPRPSSGTGIPQQRPDSGTGIPQQRPSSAFAEPPNYTSGSGSSFSPPAMFEEEEPTQMAPFDFSGVSSSSASPSSSSLPQASSGFGVSSAFGAPPPEPSQFPEIVEEDEPTQMSGFLFPDGIPSSSEEPVAVETQEAAWSAGAEPLSSWRLDEGSDTQPWQRIHCHQPVLSLEVQVDRLYALLESGMRVVSYRFPGGQPIAECSLPSTGSMLLATASGLAVLHPQDALFSLWDRSNLSGIVQVSVGKMPADMALLSRNQVLVANSGDGTLSIIDLQRGAETERFHVGGAPVKILQHPRHLLILHRGHPQITLWPLTGPARN